MQNNDDDIKLHSYQDDLDTSDDVTDPLMDEKGEDPTVTLGIPASEFKNELDKEDLDELDDDVDVRDDQREYIEDLDQDPDED